MRKFVVVGVIAVVGLAGVLLYKRNGSETSAAARRARPAPAVVAALARRCRWSSPRSPAAPSPSGSTIVGTLIGAATVEAVPKVNGRLQEVNVRLGDPVRRGQAIAKVEDREIREQVNQAEAAFKVSDATIRQREADLKLAQTNLDRNKSLLERQLLPRQTYDDTEARYQAAVAQLDLARAQHSTVEGAARRTANQSGQHGDLVSGRRLHRQALPRSGCGRQPQRAGGVGRRHPHRPDGRQRRREGRQATHRRDGRRRSRSMRSPGEKFVGRVSRLAPVFDPQTRTAEMEIEVPNQSYRLKPGMYARVELTPRQPAERADAPPRGDRGARGQERCVRRERAGASLKCGAVAGRRSCAHGAVRAGRASASVRTRRLKSLPASPRACG